jgi:hypothetical protein
MHWTGVIPEIEDAVPQKIRQFQEPEPRRQVHPTSLWPLPANLPSCCLLQSSTYYCDICTAHHDQPAAYLPVTLEWPAGRLLLRTRAHSDERAGQVHATFF